MQELYMVLNMPQYGWICLNRTWMCPNMSGFAKIDMVLSMSISIHHTRLLHNLVNTYWETRLAYSKPCQRSKIECFGKIIIAFNYFFETLHLKFLRRFWICVEFEICQGSEYSRTVNMQGFWISRVTRGLPIFVNMTG